MEKENCELIYANDVMNKETFTYRELIPLINSFVLNLKSGQFLECQISSETEITIENKEILLDAFVDTEWDIPAIKFSKNLVWRPQKNEITIEIEELSESLISVYSSQSDYCLTIVFKEVFYKRKVSDETQSSLVDISDGEINLVDNEKFIGKKKFREIVDHLIKLDYIFVVRKILVKDMEEIITENTVD